MVKVDQKKLQMKWTDIEVRRHVIPKMQADDASDDEEEKKGSDDDDLPPILEKVDKEQLIEEKKMEKMAAQGTMDQIRAAADIHTDSTAKSSQDDQDSSKDSDEDVMKRIAS